MKCKKCKNKIEGNVEYCPNCGTPVKKYWKIGLIVAVIMILGFIIFFAGMYILVFSILGKVENIDYIELGEYKVPNIVYKSDYKLCHYSYSNTKVELEPCKKFSDDFLDDFIEDMEKSGYTYIEDENGGYLTKKTEDGQEIEIILRNKKIKYILK